MSAKRPLLTKGQSDPTVGVCSVVKVEVKVLKLDVFSSFFAIRPCRKLRWIRPCQVTVANQTITSQGSGMVTHESEGFPLPVAGGSSRSHGFHKELVIGSGSDLLGKTKSVGSKDTSGFLAVQKLGIGITGAKVKGKYRCIG